MLNRILAAAAIGTALVATPVLAGDKDAPKGQIVYRDLNLQTEEGQKVLAARIDQAAREICNVGDVATGTLIESRSQRACYEKAKKSATSQMASLIEDARRGG